MCVYLWFVSQKIPLCSFLKTQFFGMHQGRVSSVYFLVGRGGTPLLVCTLYFLSLMGRAPQHFLPSGVWPGRARCDLASRVFPAALSQQSRSKMEDTVLHPTRWRRGNAQEGGGGGEARVLASDSISYRTLYSYMWWRFSDELIIDAWVKWHEFAKITDW